MSDPQLNNELQRMWQEAEVYERQGLYDHAVLVYQNILNRDPDNKKAQAKVVQIQFAQKIEEGGANPQATGAASSPHFAKDLGMAYVGMKLYSEALEEFQKAITAASGPDRLEIQRYAAGCLLRNRRFDEAKAIIDAFVDEPAVPSDEKSEFIEEIVGACIEEGLMTEARDLLVSVPEELRSFISDYDLVLNEVASTDPRESGYEILLEDMKTGVVYRTDRLSDGPAAETLTTSDPRSSTRIMESFIPLNVPVSYSTDNKNWREGTALRVSAGGALLRLSDTVPVGESLVIKLHLPQKIEEDPVWVVSRIVRPDVNDLRESMALTKVQFVSFLPGAEAVLKKFIDEIVKNPALLSEIQEQPKPNEQASEPHPADTSQGPPSEDILSVLQAEVDKVRETEFLDMSVPKPVPKPKPISKREPARAVKSERKYLPRIRFACRCGQIHVVPAKHVGRQGACSGCGEMVTVPLVDPRLDSLSEQMIGKLVGGCRLLYKIGGGGMGGVFRGHHLALDISVAVKLLHAHLAEEDPIFIRRFIREARAAARLQHPNVVGVMNVGYEQGIHYLVMPYVPGGSAAALLNKAGKLPVANVLQIGIEITKALNVAEEHKLIHRDIKPANILFNARGEAMLADLGLAKHYEAQDAGLTQTGITCGTPLYFSPEQAKGAPNLDIRSDIYSLGITLYHLLTGAPPFMAESAYMIFQKHVHDPLPPFKDTSIPLAEEMFQALTKMTTKNPDDRFQDSYELLEALEDLKHELKVRTRSETPSKAKRGLLERLGIKKEV